MVLITVTFGPIGKKVKIRQGTNILNAAIERGVALRTECGGNGACGKCRVIVSNREAVGEPTSAEERHLSKRELASGYRLACQIIPKGNVKVLIPKESRIGKRQILAHGTEKRTVLDPMITKLHVILEKPTLLDTTPDFERILRVLQDETTLGRLTVCNAVLMRLPDTLRHAHWNVTIVFSANDRIIAVEPGDTTHRLFGFAVDIGTSKIAGHLVDLTSGKTLGTSYTKNPQLTYGADIISRIAFAVENEANLLRLQEIVLEAINEILTHACEKAKVDLQEVYETVLVGNTAMHHLCLGIQPKYTAESPYVPAIKSTIDLSATELGLRMNPNGIVNFLPIIAGFVGADAVADVLATSFNRLKKPSLLIDIGTNTEVCVRDLKDIVSCSCASGPAFEGARIKHGMKAEIGAIESVQMDSDFDVEFKTIGNTKPSGVCGSAIIDAVAEMFKHGIIDSRGRFTQMVKTPRLRKNGSQTEFVLARRTETATKRDIVITQKDVGEVQLAKAAIYVGCSTLMKAKELKEHDLDRILVAGDFGHHINAENAKTLGLLPDVPTKRIEFVGNTALEGAKMALVSRQTRKEAENLSNQIRYLELATAPDFAKEFADALFIPHRDIKRFPTVHKPD